MLRTKIFQSMADAVRGSLRALAFGGNVLVAMPLAVVLVVYAGGEGSAPEASAAPAVITNPQAAEGVAPACSGEPMGAAAATHSPLAGGGVAPTCAGEPVVVVARKHPANLLQLPPSVEGALVFDLRNNRAYVFGNRANRLADFYVALGKQGAGKRVRGDEKTPIGVYFVESYIPGDTLPPIYGAGAFPVDYPSAWDRRLGRTGSGIWIHGTDKDPLPPLASRGCLTLYDTDFLEMSPHVQVGLTPVIVANEVSWVSTADAEAERRGVAAAIEAWRQDWESRDIDSYLEHYSRDFRTDSMSRDRWIARKRQVNAAKTFIEVRVDEVGIYRYPGETDLVLATFEQSYSSNNFNSRVLKHQYWRREDGVWRIVHESNVPGKRATQASPLRLPAQPTDRSDGFNKRHQGQTSIFFPLLR